MKIRKEPWAGLRNLVVFEGGGLRCETCQISSKNRGILTSKGENDSGDF